MKYGCGIEVDRNFFVEEKKNKNKILFYCAVCRIEKEREKRIGRIKKV